jgi:hypothetical protein
MLVTSSQHRSQHVHFVGGGGRGRNMEKVFATCEKVFATWKNCSQHDVCILVATCSPQARNIACNMYTMSGEEGGGAELNVGRNMLCNMEKVFATWEKVFTTWKSVRNTCHNIMVRRLISLQDLKGRQFLPHHCATSSRNHGRRITC